MEDFILNFIFNNLNNNRYEFVRFLKKKQMSKENSALKTDDHHSNTLFQNTQQLNNNSKTEVTICCLSLPSAVLHEKRESYIIYIYHNSINLCSKNRNVSDMYSITFTCLTIIISYSVIHIRQ